MKIHKVPNKGVYARIGDFFGPLRKTEKQATEALDRQLENYKPLNHKYLRANDGSVFHVFQMPNHDFTINIIRPKGLVLHVRGRATLAETITRATVIADKHFGGVDYVSN